ncbi:MAG: outer membrane beta-barrel protein [Bacteroidetes bacterium]|nr:outer membrane beta-barrel protein [Bacteroidota bacterium]
MKKLTLFAVAFAALTPSMAQIGKGSLFLGLDLNFSSAKSEFSVTSGGTTTITDKVKSSSWNFGPSAQYFFMDNMSVGLSFGIGQSRWENEDPTSKDKISTLDKNTFIGLNLRKYWNCADDFYLFGQLGFGMNPSKGEMESYDGQSGNTVKTTYEVKNTNVGLGAGIAWMATDKLMFQGNIGLLGWTSTTSKFDINSAGDQYDTNKGSNFGLSFSTGNIPFNLGFAYLITGGGE